MDKFVLKSKTIQGLIVAALPLLDAVTGVEAFKGLEGAIGSFVTELTTFVGLVWAAIGRAKAEGKLKIM